MNEHRKRGAMVGSASLILIFIVLCLGTFGLMALSSGAKDLELARRNESAIAEYYRADGEGERFRIKVLQALDGALADNPDDPRNKLEELLGDSYNREDDTARTEIPMDNDRALSVVLKLSWEEGTGSADVLEWNVINVVEYEIDQDMPVWDGQ